MALVETLVLTVGSAVAKSILTTWLKEKPLATATTTSILEVLKSKTNDVLAARNGARQFEAIEDKVAANLVPVFRSYEFDQVSRDASYQAVAEQVALAITRASISAQLLAKFNNEPSKLSHHIQVSYPVGNRDLSELESALYKRSIDLSAQYIVDLASNLPDFDVSNFAELLHRMDILMVRIDMVMADLDKLRVESESSNPSKLYADFETDYRATIVRQLDKINLFGAEVSRRVKKYQLSVAYISLDVCGLDDDSSKLRLPIEDALATSQFVAIVGEAGSGKTTLLHWLAVNSAANSFPKRMNQWRNTIPFIIELRRYPDELPTPEKFFHKMFPELADQVPSKWITGTLRDGRAILLVDGLDEVPYENREYVIDWLDDLLLSYPSIIVVFTSRPAAYEPWMFESQYFNQFQLTPMENNDIEMFVEQWHRAVLIDQKLESEESARVILGKLLTKLKNRLPLMRLSTNPLLCAMICALHYDRQMQLPSDRNALYEACVNMLLERRDIEKKVHLDHLPETTYKQKRVLLDDLAYWMLKNGYSSISSEQAKERIGKRIKNMNIASYVDTESVLKMLVERSGIIREPSQGIIDFVHRTFQEYMAASAAFSERDWGLLIKHAPDDQWQETIILAAGFANYEQANGLIDDLLDLTAKTKSEEHQTYLQLLAISCLETAVEISPHIRQRVEQLLGTLIPPQKTSIALRLSAAGNMVVPFLTYKDSYSEQESTTCVQLLSVIGTRPALLKLGTFINDKRETVREAIWKALEKTNPNEVLASGLANDLKLALKDYIHEKEINVHGSLLYGLSTSASELKAFLPEDTTHLRIKNFRPSNTYFINLLTGLRAMFLSGDVGFDFNSIGCNSLELLDLRNEELDWPNFAKLERFSKLSSIRMNLQIPHIYDEIETPWPNFFDLSNLPNLKELSIFSIFYEDLPDLQLVSELEGLEYLHLGAGNGFWPDLQPLENLSDLTFLELSTDSPLSTNQLFGIEDLSRVKNIRLNLGAANDKSEMLYDQLKMIMPRCQITVNIGWSSKNW